MSRTPLGVSLFGGGTDYASYFRDMPGAVLETTINRYVYIQALPLALFAEQRFRLRIRGISLAKFELAGEAIFVERRPHRGRRVSRQLAPPRH